MHLGPSLVRERSAAAPKALNVGEPTDIRNEGIRDFEGIVASAELHVDTATLQKGLCKSDTSHGDHHPILRLAAWTSL